MSTKLNQQLKRQVSVSFLHKDKKWIRKIKLRPYKFSKAIKFSEKLITRMNTKYFEKK